MNSTTGNIVLALITPFHITLKGTVFFGGVLELHDKYLPLSKIMVKVYKVWKLNLQIEIFGLKLNTPRACYSATKLLSISVSCLIFSSLDWLLTSNLLLISHKICTVLEVIFSSVQSLSRVRLFVTPWTAALQASLSITNSRSLPKPISIESVMPSNHLILCRPLLLLPSIFPSIRVFSNESALCISWPKYWSFSFNIRPSNECPGLISFRMDWLATKHWLLNIFGTKKLKLKNFKWDRMKNTEKKKIEATVFWTKRSVTMANTPWCSEG